MSFAPKQFIRSVDFLSTENAINTSTGCVNIYGGMSVSKDSYLTNMIVVGNSTVTNLNITGALITSTGNTLTSSQWTSIDSNSDIYFGTSANAFVGIGTTTPTFNLDISGGSRITGGLTVGNLNVNTGATITNILNTTICTGTTIVSGGITTSTIRVTGNADLSTGLTTVTDLTGTNITSATIRASTLISTANLGANNVSSGTIQASTLISTANLATNNFSSGTIRATTLITSANITANNFTANNLISSNITSSNLRVSGTINSGDITVGNINFTGSLYQNGSAYLGSQWTTTSGNTLTYTSGNVSINSGFSSTFNSNTLGNIFTTGGNVGIGIAPTSKLHVHASDFPNIKLTTDNVYVNSIDLDSTNKTGGVYWRLMSTHQDASEGQGKFVISQVTSGLDVLGLTSSGNVGIRTLNPSTTLDVSGTGRITTSLTTGALFSTNQTTTNIVGTNISTGTLNATTIATALLTASTSVSTTSLLATSASIGNISAASINLSSNLNVAGTLTVVNVTTTNLTMSNGNALLNLVTSGSIINTGTITSGPLMLRTPNNYDGRILTLSTLTVGNVYNLTIDAVNNTSNNIYWSLGQNTLSSTYSNMLTFYGGNVGINTTQPGNKLDVSGTARITTSLTTGSLFSTNQTTTNIVGTNLSTGTLNATTMSTVILTASTSITTGTIRVTGNADLSTGLTTVTDLTGTNITSGTIRASTLISTANLSAGNITGGTVLITGSAGTGTNGSTLITGYDSYGHSLYIGSYAAQKRLAFNHNGTTGNIFAYDYGAVAARNLVLQGPGGNVGIGATSPSRLLSLSGPSSNIVNGPHIWINTSDSPVNPVFQQLNWTADNVSLNFDMYYDGAFRNSGSSVAWQIYKSNSQLRFMLQNGTAGSSNGQFNAMILGSTGNVGIGSASSAAYILDVAGTTRITNTTATSMGTLIVAGPGSTGYTPSTTTSGQLASFYGPGGANIFSHIDLSTYLPSTGAMSLPAVRFSMKDLGANNSDFNILTKNAGSTGTMASRIFINGSGNVGINTTSPSYITSIRGSGGTSGTVVAFYNTSNLPLAGIGLDQTNDGISFLTNVGGSLLNTVPMFINRVNSNVGIGTTSPSARVHAFSSDTLNTMFVENNGGGGGTQGSLRVKVNATSGVRNILQLENASSTVMLVRDDGNVGIGTTSPSARLDVIGTFEATGTTHTIGNIIINSTNTTVTTNTNGEGLFKIGNSNAGSSAYGILRVGNNAGDAVMFLNSNTRTLDGGASTFTIRNDAGALRLQGSGATNTIFLPGSSTNVGVNTSSPRANLEITQTSSTTGMMLYSGSNDGGVNRIIFNHSDTTSNYQKVSIETQALGTSQAGRSNFSIRVNTANDNTNVAAGDTRFFIHGTSGNIGIMTTSPSYPLHVSGDIYATGDVISFSDARLKSDVETITGALDKVNNMRGVYYTNLNTQTRETGVIAQEIMDVLPEVVADRGEYLGVAYGNIVGVLIEAIKELKARVAELENR